jgi:hypothetical protein
VTFDTNSRSLSMMVMYEDQQTGELDVEHFTDFAKGAALLQSLAEQLTQWAKAKGNA